MCVFVYIHIYETTDTHTVTQSLSCQIWKHNTSVCFRKFGPRDPECEPEAEAGCLTQQFFDSQQDLGGSGEPLDSACSQSRQIRAEGRSLTPAHTQPSRTPTFDPSSSPSAGVERGSRNANKSN